MNTKTTTGDPTFDKSLIANQRLHQIIPGGSHTYSKGDDQFPEFFLPIMERGEGCHAWDIDGNKFVEYGMGLRSVTLGHAFPEVVEAASAQLKLGSNFTRPSIIELKAAETFLEIVPGAEMVKFCKNGSDATTAALKLARACTGRELVAICGDHPFFSIDDWFIGATEIDSGIPRHVKEQTLKFRYNDLDSLQELFASHPGEIACVFLEPEKNDPPRDEFLHKAREICHQNGALFILDEMITGFRWHLGGAQTLYGITPDLSTFGKAMGNGIAVSALAGKREFMDRGGLWHEDERVFLLSTTHGAETHALAAFLAVVKAYRDHDVIEKLRTQGARLKIGLDASIASHSLTEYIGILGHPACLVCATSDDSGPGSQPFRTLMLQESIRRGIIAPNLVISYAHSDEVVDHTIEVMDKVFEIYRKALDEGVEKYLIGRSVQPVYRKRNNFPRPH